MGVSSQQIMGPYQLALPIVTERLILREFTPADAPAMRGYMAEPPHWIYQLISAPSEQHLDNVINNILAGQADPNRDHYALGVALKTAPEVVIGEGIVSRNGDHNNRQGEIGFGLAESAWGRGYGSEVAEALLTAGFRQMKLHRLSARCSPENLASVRVLEKAGMQREALLRDQVYGRGRWWSTAIYGLLESEYTRAAASWRYSAFAGGAR